MNFPANRTLPNSYYEADIVLKPKPDYVYKYTFYVYVFISMYTFYAHISIKFYKHPPSPFYTS